MRKSAMLVGMSLFALAACSTGVEQGNFTANLNAAQELAGLPAGSTLNAGDGSGTATGNVQVTTDAAVATFTLTVNGLTGITAAHIHSASAGTAGTTTGPIAVFLFDGPTIATAHSGVLNRSSFGQATITAGAGAGSANTYDALVTNIRNRVAYVNVHTSLNGGGAIRGNF